MFASVVNLDRATKMMAKGNSDNQVFKVDTQCLTNFLALVKEHFDVF